MIIYAGAIMVLFLFAVMLLNLGREARDQEREWLRLRAWIGPSLLAAVLLVELVYLVIGEGPGGSVGATGLSTPAPTIVGPKEVGISLFGPYLLGVELASILLLAGLVGAHRLTREEE